MVEDLNTLYYFTQVVEHQGFAAAGRALDMPKSKLSRRIAELEERLGVRLLHRSSRHCSLTEIGQAYYQRCLAMRVEAESAAELIERNRSEPQGVVRISCPTALLNSWVGPMLTRYLLKYPLVELFIESTNRRVDLIHEGFDIALRVRFPPLENTDMVMKVLGNRTQSVVGSPTFLPRLSTPASPADLSGVPTPSAGSAVRQRPDRLDRRSRVGKGNGPLGRQVRSDLRQVRFHADRRSRQGSTGAENGRPPVRLQLLGLPRFRRQGCLWLP